MAVRGLRDLTAMLEVEMAAEAEPAVEPRP